MKCLIVMLMVALPVAYSMQNKEPCFSAPNGYYDPEIQLCCSFGVTNLKNEDNETLKCCNESTIVQSKELCCEDVVFNKSGDDNFKCCGSQTFEPDQEICCNNKLYNKTSDSIDCCGHLTINVNTHQCCKDRNGNGKPHKKKQGWKCCDAEYFNKKTHHCFRGRHILKSNITLCKKTEYDVRQQKCCNGKLYNVTELSVQHSYCNTSLYNTTERKCCYGRHLIPRDAECGKTGYYNVTHQRCCNSIVLTVNKETDDCCGSTLYDTQYQGCCGSTPYTKSTSECCRPDGEIIEKESNKKCCGPKKYDKDDFVCCMQASENPHEQFDVIKKEIPEHNMCCIDQENNKKQSYANNTDRCSVGKVITRGPMCGKKRYNIGTDLCCSGVLFEGGKQHDRRGCCGVKDYSRVTEICCDTEIFSLTDKKSCNKEIRKDASKRHNTNQPILSHGICSYCNHRDKDLDSLLGIFPNFCNMKALKILVEENYHYTDKLILNGFQMPKMSWKRQPITLQLPCTCPLETKTIILLTNIEDYSHLLRVGDSDRIIPWTYRIDLQIRKMQRKCLRNQGVSAMKLMLKFKLSRF